MAQLSACEALSASNPSKQLVCIRKDRFAAIPGDLCVCHVQVPHCLHVCLHRLIIGCRNAQLPRSKKSYRET